MTQFQRVRLFTAQIIGTSLLTYRPQRKWQTEDRRLIILVPVWGEAYVSMWTRFGARTLLAPGNRSIFRDRDVTMVIFTNKASEGRLRESDVLQALGAMAHVVFIDLHAVSPQRDVTASANVLLSAAQWAATLIAREDRADIMMLTGDGVYSDGSLGYVLERADDGGKSFLGSTDLEISANQLAQIEHVDDPCLTISHQEAVEYFNANRGSRCDSGIYLYDGTYRRPFPGGRINLKNGSCFKVFNIQPQPIYLSHEFLVNSWIPLPSTMDKDILDWFISVFGDSGCAEMLSDPKTFVMLGIQFIDEPHDWTAAEETDAAELGRQVALQISHLGFSTAGRAWALDYPITIDGAKAPGEAGEELIAAVQGALTVPPDDGFGEVGRVLNAALSIHP